MNQRLRLPLVRKTPNRRRGALTHVMHAEVSNATAEVSTTRETLVALIVRGVTLAQAVESGGLKIEGDAECVAALFAMLDDFSMQFDVVTPGTGR